jgi:hypothetical protein
MRVFVSVDGFERFWAALEYAAEQIGNSTLVALYVVVPVEGDPTTQNSAAATDVPSGTRRKGGRRGDAGVRDRAGRGGRRRHRNPSGGRPAARTIVEYADE